MDQRGIMFEGHDSPKEHFYNVMARLNPTSYAVNPATYLHPGHNLDKMAAGLPQSEQTMKRDERADEMSSKFHNPEIRDHGVHRGDNWMEAGRREGYRK